MKAVNRVSSETTPLRPKATDRSHIRSLAQLRRNRVENGSDGMYFLGCEFGIGEWLGDDGTRNISSLPMKRDS
jgi:hypothetical protein